MSATKNRHVFDNGLVVKWKRTAVEFEHLFGLKGEANGKEERMLYTFNEYEWDEFKKVIEKAATYAWGKIKPTEAHSMDSDYWEYYSRKYDNNGYLRVSCEKRAVDVSAPYTSVDELYKFDKPKMQSFLYDLLEVKEATANV